MLQWTNPKTISRLLVSVLTGLLVVFSAAALQDDDYCLEFPENCQGEGGSGEGNTGGGNNNPEPPWPGYSDGRISPDPAEYYTIYCHEGTDTIYVVRVIPENETIKEIPLVDAINLDVGHEQPLGDFMVMARSSEDTISIYGSNGNLAPAPGAKAFSLNACIESNGGAPELNDSGPPPPDNSGDGNDVPQETEEERFGRRSREAQERLDICFEQFDFFSGDSDLLVGCLDDVVFNYSDVLPGIELLTLIVMIFCLNVIVGNGVLPIGIVVFLGMHRRWLRHWKPRSD